MAGSPFYDTGAIGKLATNLLHGWGYNFYKTENQLRADDLMIRARISEILGAARAEVEAAEAAYRREFLPAPSRAKPRHDPNAVRGAQLLEGIGHALGAVEGQVRALPVPETDRMTQRFRREAETLIRLAEADLSMVGHVEFLRALLADATGAWMIENTGEINQCIAAIRSLVQQRGDLLAF